MGLFLSTFINRVDKKGRISVPASFRESLAGLSFSGIIAFPSFTDSCIEGCGIDRMEQLSEGTERFDAFSSEQEDIATMIFAASHRLAFDPEGRIMLPEILLKHAGIGETAAFVGKGKRFQIWEPAAYEAASAAALARAKKSRPTLSLIPSGDGS